MPKSRKPRAAPRAVTGPRSLMRLLGLLDALAKSPKDGLGLAELNTALKSPKSSLLNLLRPLVATGYLSVEAGRYRLGPSIFRLAGTIMSVWNFSNIVRPYLEELSQRSGESVYMGVLDPADKVITYVDAIESPHSVRFTVAVGASRPLYATAAGRVLLAFADKRWQDDYIATTKLQAYTEATTTTQRDLRDELDRVRKTRLSVSIGEMFPQSAAIAAPIFGADGKIAAAMAVGGPTDRLEPRIAEIQLILADVAARASGMGGMAADASEAISQTRKARRYAAA